MKNRTWKRSWLNKIKRARRQRISWTSWLFNINNLEKTIASIRLLWISIEKIRSCCKPKLLNLKSKAANSRKRWQGCNYKLTDYHLKIPSLLKDWMISKPSSISNKENFHKNKQIIWVNSTPLCSQSSTPFQSCKIWSGPWKNKNKMCCKLRRSWDPKTRRSYSNKKWYLIYKNK